MPTKTTLQNGLLQRNGKPLQCPFATRVVFPDSSRFQAGALVVKASNCGAWCPLFMDLPANEVDRSTLPHRVRLFCVSGPVEYAVEDVPQEAQHAPTLVTN